MIALMAFFLAAAQLNGATRASDPFWAAALAPPTVRMYLHVDGAAEIRAEIADRPIARWVQSTLAKGELLDAWGPCPGCAADFSGDLEVGAADLVFLLESWGPCPSAPAPGVAERFDETVVVDATDPDAADRGLIVTHVYATGETDDTLVVFSRDATQEELTFLPEHVQENLIGGVFGLDGATAVTLSPDDAQIFVASRFDDAVAVFTRDATTDSLAFTDVAFAGLVRLRGACWASAGPFRNRDRRYDPGSCARTFHIPMPSLPPRPRSGYPHAVAAVASR